MYVRLQAKQATCVLGHELQGCDGAYQVRGVEDAEPVKDLLEHSGFPVSRAQAAMRIGWPDGTILALLAVHGLRTRAASECLLVWFQCGTGIGVYGGQLSEATALCVLRGDFPFDASRIGAPDDPDLGGNGPQVLCPGFLRHRS